MTDIQFYNLMHSPMMTKRQDLLGLHTSFIGTMQEAQEFRQPDFKAAECVEKKFANLSESNSSYSKLQLHPIETPQESDYPDIPYELNYDGNIEGEGMF